MEFGDNIGMADWWTHIRHVGNAVNGSTALGLITAALGRSKLSLRGDLVIAEHYRLPFPIAGAFTIGDVVIVPSGTLDDLIARYPDVVEHERGHAWQYTYCFGLPFLMAYTAAMGWSWLRTGDRAAANFFEVTADLAKGGYRELPKRWIREGATVVRQEFVRDIFPEANSRV